MKSLRSYFYRVEGAVGILDKNEALVSSAGSGNAKDVKDLLDAGADVHAKGDFSLLMAAVRGHTPTVRVLLEAGAIGDDRGGFALQRAEEEGHTETARVLKEWMVHKQQTPLPPATQPG